MAGNEGGGSGTNPPSVHEQAVAPKSLSPRAGAMMSLVLAVLLGALSVLVMAPAARHLRSLQDGERAQATLTRSGSCMAGNCQVTFEANGRTVVADLPVGSGGGKFGVGTRWAVRYQADDPLMVAREEDTGGGGALVLAVLSGACALFFLVPGVWMALSLRRQRRRADIGPRHTSGGTPDRGTAA
ncbi:DUF3592 domain-containing protein [Streptomyces hydrogenans]|uniref:DUF3592 domain-containing protein n=1 Tax=Streptomyces hydrogenans TaxID=1873719 RepID=UPI00362AC9EA